LYGAKTTTFSQNPGAHPYKRDLKDVEIYILDTGHFALEEDYDVIAEKISGFFSSRPQLKAVIKS
jgi:hypothetical protein